MSKPIFKSLGEIPENSSTNKQLLNETGLTIYELKRQWGMNASEIYSHLQEVKQNEIKQENIKIRKANEKLRKQFITQLADWNGQELKIKIENIKIRKTNEKLRKLAADRHNQELQIKIEKLKAKIRAKREKDVTFLLHITVSRRYKKRIDGEIVLSKEYSVNLTEGPFTIKKSSIPSKVEEYNVDQYSHIDTVIGYNVEYMKTATIAKNSQPKHKQMMKRGFILKNDWLHYAKSISENAFVETDDKCVYYQLEKYLSNPPTGRPTQFIQNIRMSENALYDYFKLCIGNVDFDIHSGVSTEMIAKLCKAIKRNMYAYDENQKCFYNVTCNDSKNYCPIVFYKIHGHFYLLDEPFAIRSVAESNKDTARKIVTSSIEENITVKDNLTVFHIDKFPLDNIHELESGIYILQQSNINKEVLQYISKYSSVPKTKNNENIIVQITVKNSEDKDVYIACDTNYASNIDYDKLKNVANVNELDYVNEGVGSVIHSLLDANSRFKRKYLTDDSKKDLISLFNNKCAMCHLTSESYIIDHILPLACGGSNEMSNLQPLCIDCNRKKTVEENEQGIYKIKDPTVSYFNDIVFNNIINTSYFKVFQFVENVNYSIMGDNVFKIDMRKCRRNIALNCKYEYPVYSVMDIPKQYQGVRNSLAPLEVKCGMYYVITENTFPFRGCGWYFEPLVQYGLDNGFIVSNDIKLEFLPSKKLPADHLQKPITELLNSFSCEPELQKLCINAFIGLMGRTKQVASYSKFSLCPNESSNWFTEKHSDYDVFIRNHKLDNGHILYEGIFSQSILQESTKYPMYAMILQMEAIELHKLETIITDVGGTILDRNTDAIRYSAESEVMIDTFFWDDAKTVPKYQKEDAKKLGVERLPHMLRKHYLDLNVFDLNWNICYDYECSVEQKASEILDSNKSVHIDGRAGTGKTYLANKVIEEMKSREMKYIAFSPTNKGARLIGGKTIHSMYYKYMNNKKKLFAMMKNIDYILIDEVSMMIEKFYQLFMMLKRTFPKLKFVIVGDFDQLPPVKDSWTGDYKNSASMFSLCDGNRVQLTMCRRADTELFNLCKNVNSVNVNHFAQVEKTYLNIAYTHKTRIRVNQECMDRYLEGGRKYTFIAKDVTNPKTQYVKLAVGMPIIAHTTNKKLDILNSEKFNIKKLAKDNLVVSDGNRDIEIKLADFHKLFYLGFCITVHASQGETFSDKYTIYDWNFKHFCDKAKYVALSRATDISNIQIVASKNSEIEFDEDI